MELSQAIHDLIKHLSAEVPKLNLTPAKGWIVCLDLPAGEKTSSGIVLAGQVNQQFTTGVVLKVYNPYEKELTSSHEDGHKVTKSLWVECEFAPGDIVVYPHYAGRNLENDKQLRFVEVEGGLNDSGCIVGTLSPGDAEILHSRLATLVEGFEGHLDDKVASVIASALTEKFIIVDKEVGSTLTGV